ncbi:c-di-GMP-binding flagellar brake protein YcgR, contains PilZNR and PilZ domains [Proteiniborus ethanoligenes]|uniref:C-di-GMP-binding flagellar brake protein YcgR, contains PilZNR and PilZ domains n=1 Tax=Proteiniborus ethanoligenes TaxID=415015 RepID=A0A1H3N5R9_9FIRM|nr:PilZ domain-containing protein [Proteiniborus ethanoligenes]SDY83825.1 c-di-GMP-binding flagellar brake protein YcgR, contains PilZNR and PilZ domains [Proteiniborus ethanoligenes]
MVIDSLHINVGDKIQISRIENSKINHSSQVLDILNEKEYVIAGPIRRSTIVHISINSIIEITYYKENKGKFVFKAIVTEKIEKGIYKLVIKRIGDIKRIQDRNYFRLELSLKVVKRFETKENGVNTILVETCKTKDISGGGVRLFSNYKHELHDKLFLTIYIDNKELDFLGEVVRVIDSSGNEYKYEIGVKFADVISTEREIIIKYIFEQQRELRKKGLI